MTICIEIGHAEICDAVREYLDRRNVPSGQVKVWDRNSHIVAQVTISTDEFPTVHAKVPAVLKGPYR